MPIRKNTLPDALPLYGIGAFQCNFQHEHLHCLQLHHSIPGIECMLLYVPIPHEYHDVLCAGQEQLKFNLALRHWGKVYPLDKVRVNSVSTSVFEGFAPNLSSTTRRLKYTS
eukprot:957543-Amphidinium_carterae.2